jgi:transposase-like protein
LNEDTTLIKVVWTPMQVEILNGIERRRWSEEEKARITEESCSATIKVRTRIASWKGVPKGFLVASS